jgi:AcrR family transcriptional regulator
MTGHRRSGRRTNVERTATTRARLLDATVTSLAERGYAATTTTEVSRRSGVSRGALLHHFPSRQELVLAAVEHVVERRIEEVRAVGTRVPDGAHRVDMALELLWTTMRGPTFSACFELIVAARTDPGLRAAVAEMGGRLDDGILAAAAELFPPPSGEMERFTFDSLIRLVFAVLYGLAFQSFTGGPAEEANATAVLFLLKRIARMFDAAGRVPEMHALVTALLSDGDPDVAGVAAAAAAAAAATAAAPPPPRLNDPDLHPDETPSRGAP